MFLLNLISEPIIHQITMSKPFVILLSNTEHSVLLEFLTNFQVVNLFLLLLNPVFDLILDCLPYFVLISRFQLTLHGLNNKSTFEPIR